MADDRNCQKQHIRAARDWLGKAEFSLDQQNDVEGDLKLMLARAELSHVKESPQSQKLRHFANRIVPLAVAVLLLLVGSWGWQNLMGTEKSTQSLPQMAMPVEKTVPNNSDEDDKSLPSVQSVPSAEITNDTVRDTTTPVVQESDLSVPTIKAEQQPTAVPPVAKSVAVPSLEQQQLMQAAGKALRQ